MTALVKKDTCIDNFDNPFDPNRDLFKHVSKFDLFTLLVPVDLPTFRNAGLFRLLRCSLNLGCQASVREIVKQHLNKGVVSTMLF